jgi:hypothetical protein
MSKEIQAKDVKRLLLKVYRKYQSGAITEAQATKEAYLLNSILKAIETTDIEERVEKLETINIINLGTGSKP